SRFDQVVVVTRELEATMASLCSLLLVRKKKEKG
ncbi:hypothetical protein A2U01_0078648, partial [Trifolium medium]|nr:hypothetical protein [Trifolium medium]